MTHGDKKKEKPMGFETDAVASSLNADHSPAVDAQSINQMATSELKSPKLRDCDLGLEKFISVANCRPPIEVYRHHPAVDAVAKALMVAYREHEMVGRDDGVFDFLPDAARILWMITSDGRGGLLYEGISAEAIRQGEILEQRRETTRHRMRHRGCQPRERNNNLIRYCAELMAPTDDDVFLQIAASLISAEKPSGSALATAWRYIRNSFIPQESWLNKDIEWHQMPWYSEPETPQTEVDIDEAKARAVKERAVDAFGLCLINAANWRSAVLAISDELDVEFSRQANKLKKALSAQAKVEPDQVAKPVYKPVDLWGKFDPPDLPRGLLPPLIEEFAFTMGEQMGADPAGIAMACLCVCGAAIPDTIKVKVKRHADWYESARIWVCVVGAPSTKKSPILSAATRPLSAIDSRMLADWLEKKKRFEALPPEDRKGKTPPPQIRLRIEDTTIEAAQVVLEGSTNGILCFQDELSGFFGSLDKYGGGKGASADRAFWLKSYNGGEYALNRVGRGAMLLENLSISLLGGIQPEPIRKIASEAQDDGLLQRMLPIILKPSVMGKDQPVPDVGRRYSELVEQLNRLQPPGWANMGTLEFDDDAMLIRTRQEERHLTLMSSESISRKLASHVGKYDGLFARLCVIWHCIKHDVRDSTSLGTVPTLPHRIDAATAQEVADFMEMFLLPHAIAFYFGTLGLSDDHDRICAIANYILAHNLQQITNRDVQRGDRAMRGLADKDIRPLLEQLEALGWLTRTSNIRPSLPPIWQVNPMVHKLYAERATKEAARRTEAKTAMAQFFQKAE